MSLLQFLILDYRFVGHHRMAADAAMPIRAIANATETTRGDCVSPVCGTEDAPACPFLTEGSSGSPLVLLGSEVLDGFWVVGSTDVAGTVVAGVVPGVPGVI